LTTTTFTTLSLPIVQTGIINKNTTFDQQQFVTPGLVYIPFGWIWIGQTSYPISNNAPNFILNIHFSVAIYNPAGNSGGSGPPGMSIPILRSN